MNVKIHTQGWVLDRPKGEGEEATGSIHVVLELDGKVFLEVLRVETVFAADDFTEVVAHLVPGELDTIVHDKNSWDALCQDARDPAGAERRAPYRVWLRDRKE